MNVQSDAANAFCGEGREPLIALRNISKRYTRGRLVTEVLRDISMDVEAGTFLALMGPSGSGKTTILNIISALDRANKGDVRVVGASLNSMSSYELSRWRAHNVGFVFQSYNLLGTLNAFRNVELPLLLTKLSTAQRKRHVEAALELVGFRTYARARISELSGGQQQRIAIARAIVADPPLLICDEPTGDLDRQSADEVLELLRLLNGEFNKTIILVTHDPIAAAFANRHMRIDKGKLQLDRSS